MSDNLTDIKNSVKNIDDKITNLTQNGGSISEMEKTLGTISAHTKTIDGIKTDTKNTADGISQIMSKLDALDTIQKWTKTQSGNSKNGRANNGGVKGTIDSKIDSLVNYQKEIHGFTNTIATNTDNISTNTREAADYLKAIKEHIVDGGVSTKSQPVSSNNVTGETSGDIHSTVKDILKEIKGIRLDLASKQLDTGDDDLDKQLKNIAKLEADSREADARLNAYIKTGKIDGKEASRKEKREFERSERQRQREEQKRRERINGKGGGAAVITKAFTEAASLISEKQTVGKLADKGINAISQLGPVGGVLGGLMQLVKAGISLGSERDRATSTYARTIGGGVHGKLNIGDTVGGFIRSSENKADIGATFAEAMSAMTEYAEAIGRSTERIAHADVASAVSLKRFGISADAIGNFDSFGKSLRQTDEFFSRLYTDVSKKGLSFKNVSKAVNDNLKMAQSHTFANGLRGLEKMAEKSTQLKYNMQQVFQFADKVSEIEGAISTAANLSVLGGEFAQFSNPMQLLYEGLNDTEALNDRIVNMFSGKAYWNHEKGQMDMNALERERLKEAAKAAGLDPNEMLNLSYNQGKMNRISSQIGYGVSKDTAEYIKNLGELDKNGQAYVSINGEKKYLNANYAQKNGEKAMTAEDYKALQEESEKREEENSATLGRVWRNTNGIFEKLDNILAFLQERLGAWVFKMFQKIVGGEEARREEVREWAFKNNKDVDSTLDFYDKNKDKHSFKAWFNPNTKGHIFTGYDDKYFTSHMEDMISEFGGKIKNAEPEGKSPNGLPTVSNVPGTNGFANGPSHWEGGIKTTYRGQPWEIEGNEFLVNKNSSMKYRNELSQIQNGTFNPYSYANNAVKNNMDKHYMYQPVTPVATGPVAPNTQNTPNAVNGTIKVDIPHTITINIAGGNKIGDYDISGIVSKYVDAFMQEAIKRRDFAGFNKEEFYNKSGVIGL